MPCLWQEFLSSLLHIVPNTHLRLLERAAATSSGSFRSYSVTSSLLSGTCRPGLCLVYGKNLYRLIVTFILSSTLYYALRSSQAFKSPSGTFLGLSSFCCALRSRHFRVFPSSNFTSCLLRHVNVCAAASTSGSCRSHLTGTSFLSGTCRLQLCLVCGTIIHRLLSTSVSPGTFCCVLRILQAHVTSIPNWHLPQLEDVALYAALPSLKCVSIFQHNNLDIEAREDMRSGYLSPREIILL